MKKFIYFLILSFVMLSISFAQEVTEDLNTIIREGGNAYGNGDYKKFLECYQKAIKIAPNNTFVIYNLACANALNGNKDEAIKLLDKFLDLGGNYNIAEEGDFNSIKDSDEFKLILQKAERMKSPINNSEIAFKIAEKDLIPENIAFDPVEQIFYIGSIYKSKIITIDKSGTVKDFTTEKQDGLWSVIGMKVDAKRRVLWGCTALREITKDAVSTDIGYKTGIFKYDLSSKKLIKMYKLNDSEFVSSTGNIQPHFFNDLVVDSNGNVFITDSNANIVYTILADKDNIETFVKLPDLTLINGITLSNDEKYLFIASTQGIYVIDMNTKKYFPISHSDKINLQNTDGLYFYKNTLIAIQSVQNKVNRYWLSKDFTNVERSEIIESNNPLFNIPTTGVIVGDEFYYIANSQLGSFNRDGSIFPMDKLQEVVILKTKLTDADVHTPIPDNVSKLLNKIEWLQSSHQYGGSCIRISDKKVIYIDPAHIPDNQANIKADLIFISHSHDDHLHYETLAKINKKSTKIITTEDCAKILNENHKGEFKITIVKPGQTLKVDGINVEVIPAYNLQSTAHPKEKGWVGFILTIDKMRIYYSGDTSLTPEMKEIKNIDIAFFSLRDPYMMSEREIVDATRIIKPKVIIPLHWLPNEETNVKYVKEYAYPSTKVVVLGYKD